MIYNAYQNVKLSALGMGAMRLPQKGEGFNSPVDYDRAEEIIDYCVSQGVNYFDTAYVYHNGESEVCLGKALAKYPRDSFYIADKYNLLAEPDYKKQFEEQLKRLGTDYIDFYLLHSIFDNIAPDYLTNGCIEYFIEQKRLGRIKYFGFSFHGSPDTMRKVLDRFEWDFAQIQLNYYDWLYTTAKEQYELLVEKNIPIMVMEPVHGGMLASLTDEGNAMLLDAEPEKSIASWAFRFVMGLPGISVILSGMSNMEQTKDNILTLNENKALSEAGQERIKEACALLYKTVAAPCTSCRYCCDSCPQELDIPALLYNYNEFRVRGEWALMGLNALAENKRPGACVNCEACVKHCPQNLDIPQFMSDMADGMGKLTMFMSNLER